tara:strand:+ start:394 stop:1302 length:909 start_codon:yes stop_codon:yes gene_type:complete
MNLKLSNEVKIALKNKLPIVALESTLISHGLPYPQNIEVVYSSIEAVKKSGSVPAIIAVINGNVKVGLNEKNIEMLSKNNNVLKVSKHNLAIAVNNKLNAATTVASTIFIAEKIGINFFSTGGIGGVHYGAENTYDISADLNELSKTKMFVISSGPKSILDIGKTYEKLETLQIPRIGYKTNFIPGFWYYQTNKKVDYNFKSIDSLSKYLISYESIEQKNSVLIFNKIEKKQTVKKEKIEKWINILMKKANQKNIQGKDLTPYLIKEINLLSNNKTLDVNKKLIINNAKLAGKIAFKYNSIK